MKFLKKTHLIVIIIDLVMVGLLLIIGDMLKNSLEERLAERRQANSPSSHVERTTATTVEDSLRASHSLRNNELTKYSDSNE